MVNVTHDYDNRRSCLEVLRIILINKEDILFCLLFEELSIDSEAVCNEACSIEVKFLVDRCHYAELHERHDDVRALLADTFCKLLNRNECRDLDLGDYLLYNSLLGLLLLFLLLE